MAKSIQSWAKGYFTIDENVVKYKGTSLPEDLNTRIIKMATAGEDPTRLFNFWERLQKNPSWRSVKQLFQFLNHQGIPLEADGCFLAYKAVRGDYTDVHTGKFDNRPGAHNKMDRNQISDDPNHACHEGFHVGALGYASTFGGSGSRIIVCKVDPEHVVCVPYDSSQMKMRVSEYKVIGNHNGTYLPDTSFDEDRHEPLHERNEESVDNEDDEDDEDEEEETFTPPVAVVSEVPSHNKVTPDKAALEFFSKKELAALTEMNMATLLEQPLDNLRKYATHGLKIVGASKIGGGKVALVAKILEVRG